MKTLASYLPCFLLASALCEAQDAGQPENTIVPAGTVLQIRLTKALSSYTSKRGEPVGAEVISPVVVQAKTVLPRLTELTGVLADVHKVGLGFSRETALLHLQFDRLRIPGQAELVLGGRISSLDDAREHVDSNGRIRGIRATDTFGNVVGGLAITVASFDPMSMMFALSSSTAIFRIPDSSIILPAGTELKFRLEQDLAVPAAAVNSIRADPSIFADQGTAQSTFEPIVREMPFRTETKGDRQPSDLTSLLYAGSQEAIERAFAAAGWVRSDKLDKRSACGVMRSIVENQGYQAAPMSVLLLDDKEPVMAYAKTLNTFFSRHHLRIYAQTGEFRGKPLFTSTATYDSGIGFSKAARTFIHVINENIDEERAKVINDLLMTGCIDGIAYVDRPWVPLDARNATGDRLRTDGRIAVLDLNDCASPRTAETAGREAAVRLKQSAALRPVRSTVLTLRNDLMRGNIIYQGYSGLKLARSYFNGRKSDGNSEAPRTVSYAGQQFLIVEGAAKASPDPALPKDAGMELHKHMDEHRRHPESYTNRILFSLSGGLSGYGNDRFSTQALDFVSTESPSPLLLRFNIDTYLRRGWTISPSATFHHTRYISHEFAYSRTSTNAQLYARDEPSGVELDSRSKATIRRFSYTPLIHFRPNGSRFRPYAAAGPVLHLIHLADAAAQENRFLKLAARDVAFLLSAYNFGSKPPLEGGGIFQLGLQYGAGARFHVTPRFFIRGDFRETLSRQPNFWKGAQDSLSDGTSGSLRIELPPLTRHSMLRHQLVTMGIGVAF